MSHPNEAVVRAAFAAFEQGDMDAMRNKYLADDVRWHLPGRNPLSGDYEGPDQVLQYFARIIELTGGTLTIDLHDVLANDNHAVALYTIAGERAGRQLSDHQVLVFHLRDGKASEVWTQPADQYAADEFFS
jgi:ketosteroid isomerase-like protein